MAEITVPIYLTVASDSGAIKEAPRIDVTKGWTEFHILPSSLESIMRYWQDYKVENGIIKRQRLLPDLSADHLMHLIEVQNQVISGQSSTTDSLKSATAQLGGAQAKTSVDVQTTKNDVEQVKTATAMMGGQLAQMMVADTTAPVE